MTDSSYPLSKNRLAELIAASRAKLADANAKGSPVSVPIGVPLEAGTLLAAALQTEPEPLIGETGSWTWNLEQTSAIDLAESGKSFCLIGAAGTGKTTTEREIATRLVATGKAPPLSMGTKYLLKDIPGIVFTSFTRRAVRNMRKVVSAELKPHCITLHKLLEYEPMFYDVWDQVEQKNRTTMRFEPARNNLNKLPSSLKCIVIDESSMVSTDLFMNLLKALPNPDAVQFIFVGDLHQLPPVYGSAVLGFKLLDLPVVELTRIYRQAAKSPIISLAHKIKNGETIPVTTERQVVETEQGKVTIHPWKKALSDFDATHTASIFLKKLVESGNFNEEEDIILCPQEKIKNTAFGTNEFNKIIAQSLGERRQAIVHEIVAGFVVHYYAIGDRILVGREDAVIKNITKNARYWGKRPRPASIELDRWGNYKKKVVDTEADDADFDIDKYLESFTLEADKAPEERKQEASHIIEVELLDSGASETLSTAGEINAAQFAYCLTVHKSQGSEWDRVFFITHQSHVVMWNRELLYTAVTRARRELYCIVEPDRGGKLGTLTKAARSPRIKGDTLAEKAIYFQGKREEYDDKVEATRNLPQGGEKAGVYKGTVEKTAAPEIEVTKPPVKLIRLGDYVSELFKHEAQETLDALWERSKLIWKPERIGEKPKLDFTLQRAGTIGLASPTDNTIYLNAMWCIAAEDNEWIRKDMLTDTVPHELAHLINSKYSKGKGHDGGWVMAAKLLGMENPAVTTSEYPNWAGQFQAFVNGKLQELQAKAEAEGVSTIDTSSSTNIPLDSEA